jgi:hypothetical protein
MFSSAFFLAATISTSLVAGIVMVVGLALVAGAIGAGEFGEGGFGDVGILLSPK